MTITGRTRVAAVLGWPIEHSRSPALLNPVFAATGLDAVLVPLAIAPAHLPAAIATLRATGALGASVTMPHKQAVAALCDELASSARITAAVNCLEFTDGLVIGHNTDGDGFAAALAAAGVSLRGARVVILGSGGAARGVAYGVRETRAIEVIARRASEIDWAVAWPWDDASIADAFARADLLVDATSTGLGADAAAEVAFCAALPLDRLRATATVCSLTYHRRPLLLDRAAAAGLRTLDGRGMLVHQAALAFRIWTGCTPDVAAMTAGLDVALA